MNPKTIKAGKKRFSSKVFEQLSEVEEAINGILSKRTSDAELTVLVKLIDAPYANLSEVEQRNGGLRARWKELLGPNTHFGFFNNEDIGSVFIAGSLTGVFLFDVEDRKLAELSEGPYGILRGLGIDEAKANPHIKKLSQGRYLLLIRNTYVDGNAQKSPV